MKKFFFNKIEDNKTTNFSDLITSFLFGGLKILILFILNGIISSLIIPNNFESKHFRLYLIISSIVTLAILAYILVNRIPNQIKIFKNYINTNKTDKKIIENYNILEQSKNTISTTNNKTKMNFTKKEKRTVIVLMIINSFALFVNYFGLSYRFGKDADLFTNSNGINGNYTHYPYEISYNVNSKYFYPIVDFTSNNYPEGFFFKGIFAYYDTSEFIVYTILIFGVVLIRKIW